MTEEEQSKSDPKNWFEKLSDFLLREPQDKQQLVKLLRDAEHRNLLDTDALLMIEGVLQVSDMRVRDIMLPRSQMEVVDKDAKAEEFLPRIIELGHSRYPVIGENKDEVIGILHSKDLLSLIFKGINDDFKMENLIRQAVVVPESKRLNVLLQDFRAKRNHMAIVVDEYGGVSGLVTIEDVLEQIVGDIEDEYDVEEDLTIKKIGDNTYLVKALTHIDDFNEYFKSDLNDEEFDTIGGLIMQGLAHVPKCGESITIDRFSFNVLSADKRRVRTLQVTVNRGAGMTIEELE